MSQPPASCKSEVHGGRSESGDEVTVNRACSEREPLLKYRRFAKSLLFDDRGQCEDIKISCVAVHPKVLLRHG